MSDDTNINNSSNNSQQNTVFSQKTSKLATIDDLLQLLKDVKVEHNGQYKALCPAHDDHNRSLSIKQDHDKLLINCFAGCETLDILKPLGLDVSDLFFNNSVSQYKPKKTLVATFSYEYEKGKEAYQIKRYHPKDFKVYRLKNGTYVPGLGKQKPILYKLPQIEEWIQQEKTIYIPEGESKVDLLISMGLAATTAPFGAGRDKWHPEYSEYLSGADVVILPDNDDIGQSYAEEKVKSLLEKAKSVKLLLLPNLLPKGDIKDWVNAGGTKNELEALVIKCPQSQPTKKSSKASTLVKLALTQKMLLFKDQNNEACARIQVKGHFENWKLESKYFKQYLGALFYQSGETPSQENVKNTILALTGEALYGNNSQIYTLQNRVAWLEKTIYYDMSDEAWRAVKISNNGWTIENTPPILFSRYKHQAPQVEPALKGNSWLLFDVIKVPSSLQLLVLVWCISCLIPDIPHPILLAYGTEGSAKSSLCRNIRTIVDPSNQKQISMKRSHEELVQILAHNYCALFDNVSWLNEEQIDTLCRAVTGSGESKRELYSDDEDVIYNYRRCIGMNTINLAVNRPDFLDRAILIPLETISNSERLSESELEKQFLERKAKIFGGFLDTLSKAMEIKPTIKLNNKPRMADFAEWGYAITEALGRKGNEFIKAYSDNIKNRHQEILAGSMIGTILMSFMADKETWEGTATALLKLLTDEALKMGVNVNAHGFPKGANALSEQLTTLRVNLSQNGIILEKLIDVGKSKERGIRLEKTSGVVETSSLSSSSSTNKSESLEMIRDDVDDEISTNEEQNDILPVELTKENLQTDMPDDF